MSQVGYEALHNAGHRKNELKNFKCGVFVGDSGGGWIGLSCQNWLLSWVVYWFVYLVYKSYINHKSPGNSVAAK